MFDIASSRRGAGEVVAETDRRSQKHEKTHTRSLSDDALDKVTKLGNVVLLAPFTSVSDCAASFLKIPSHTLTVLTGNILSTLMNVNVKWDNIAAVKELFKVVEKDENIFRGLRLLAIHGENDTMIPCWMGKKVIKAAEHCINTMGVSKSGSGPPSSTPERTDAPLPTLKAFPTDDDSVLSSSLAAGGRKRPISAEFILLEGGNHRNITMGGPFQTRVFEALSSTAAGNKEDTNGLTTAETFGEVKRTRCCSQPVLVRGVKNSVSVFEFRASGT